MKRKSIGVLGGMGPESTVLFYSALVTQCQQQYGATADEDYPEIYIYNLPIPDITTGTADKKALSKILIAGAQKIETWGADMLTIPCNSVELCFDEIKASIGIPCISMIEETVRSLNASGYTKIGLLGTNTTVQNNLYARYANKYDIAITYPDNQLVIQKIIWNILSGKKLLADKKVLIETIDLFAKSGAEAVILGCTDLPILINQSDTEIPLINSLEILAILAISLANASVD